MPNWCFNSLVFRGRQRDLAELLGKIHGDHCHLGFGKVIPEPEGLGDERSSDGLLPGWYEWRCENWGTKWDIDSPGSTSVLATPGHGQLTLSFETAWSPSLPVTEAISKIAPSLELDHMYCDESMAAAGRAVWVGGKLAMFREFPHESWEYELVTRGIRPEDSAVQSVEWESDIPTAHALQCMTLPNDESSLPPNHPQTLESLLSRMSTASSLGAAAIHAALRAAESHGFPLEKWASAGLPLDLAWPTLGTPWSPRPECQTSPLALRHEQPAPPNGRADCPPASAPKLVLVEKSPLPNPRPLRGMGKIVRRDSGLEIVAPSGWSVSVFSREDESAMVVSRGGACQTPPDGTPPCLHWKISPQTGQPFLFASAYCAGGKLWDPAKGVPAYTEYLEDGSVHRTANFFAGSMTSPRHRGPVVPSGLVLGAGCSPPSPQVHLVTPQADRTP